MPMKKIFMLDIETTGIQPQTSDLLQIGVLELDFDPEKHAWQPGKSLELIQYTSKIPTSEFAKKHQKDLYYRSNNHFFTHPSALRRKILGFMESCGAKERDEHIFTGWNVSSFDLPFLLAKECLVAPGYVIGSDGKDVPVGDYNYRIYEIGGAVSLAQDVLGLDRKQVIDLAEAAGPDVSRGGGAGEHDALFDCYKQTRTLNGLIQLIRGSR